MHLRSERKSVLAYQFLRAADALDDLERKRLKISRITDMNDPFELLAVDLREKDVRRAFSAMRDELSRTRGVLCFSRSWHNPVMWSHYGDRHRGICLGFDLPKRKALPVAYDGKRLVDLIPRLLRGPVPQKEEAMRRLLATKYRDWKYESEVRVYTSLDTPDPKNGMYFAQFGTDLVLRKVILGPRFEGIASKVVELTRHVAARIEVIPSRLAFKSFTVVPIHDYLAVSGGLRVCDMLAVERDGTSRIIPRNSSRTP